jgi:phytanoyl-CoA hydroxylase
VETQWDPNQKLGDTFGTSEKENVSRGNYFLESANQVHFFTEPKAIENDTAASTGTMNQNENDLINTETTTKGTESSICSKEVEKKKHAETSKSQHYQHTPQRLKSEYCTPQTKIYALNKIGHGLHLIPDSTFQQYTQSNVVRQLLKDLGWRDPVVPQSMYIFKQPNHIGGIVNSHQDSTFLYTNPYPTCIGLWLALDDATIENGCLWIRPCSHNNTNDDIEEDMSDNNMESLPSLPRCNVRRHYRRNVLHFGRDTIYNRSNNPTGDIIQQPMFEMVQLFHDATVPWDGSLPGIDTTTTTAATNMEYVYESLLQAGFIPIECKAGDLLAFTGTLDHLSLGNSQHHQCSHPDLRDHSHSHGQSPLLSSSSSSRHTFQLHIVEGPSQGIEWSPLNWLQYPPNQSFMRLNSE